MDNMTPRRPYLVRAFYEWLLDNELTPHLMVDANMSGVRVPLEFVQDGQIILNVAPRAVGNIEISNEVITFQARFSGKPHSVIVPMYAVLAIYARENGAGTMFEPEEAYDNLDQPSNDEPQISVEKPSLSAVTQPQPEAPTVIHSADDGDDDPTPEPPKKSKPSLRVIK
jgi:stringent starvation protein B